MEPVAPAADVREDERHLRVPPCEGTQVGGVGRLLPGPVAAAVLPDVLQDRDAMLARRRAHRIEQRVVGAAAGGEFDADHAGREAAIDLGAGVRGVVGVDAHVAADAVGVRALQDEERIVPVRDVGGRREVDRRRPPPAAEDRRHVGCDPDHVARGQTTGVALPPVGARGAIVVKVGVDVDEHPPICYLWPSSGHLPATPGDAMPTIVDVSRLKGILLQPGSTWKTIEGEFTKPAVLYKGWVLPLALIGPLCWLVGTFIFGVGSVVGSYPLPIQSLVTVVVIDYVTR